MRMRWNLRVLRKLCGLMPLVLLFAFTEPAASEQWYFSNPAGMVLDYTPSRIIALRNAYCLSIEYLSADELPDHLQNYFQSAYRIELHILYDHGIASRRQWIFKDAENNTRLVSALSIPDSKAEENSADEPEEPSASPESAESEPVRPAGFIEIYDEHNLISEERQFFSDGSETSIRYFYQRGVLIKTETRLKPSVEKAEKAEKPVEKSAEVAVEKSVEKSAEVAEKRSEEKSAENPAEAVAEKSEEKSAEKSAEVVAEKAAEAEEEKPASEAVITDTYRYNRSKSLRAIARKRPAEDALPEGAESLSVRFTFPYLGPNIWNREQFITPVTAHTSNFMQDIFMGTDSGAQVSYAVDERGKLLTETRRDAEGVIQGELRNTWAGDRLESIEWQSGGDERRTEYEYDIAGDRILERNYNRGVLERIVRREDEQEIEELYMNGEVILRAVWENGRKISEERLRSSHPARR